ncbi:MAG: hypothetical protein GY749_23910 [Desulfobacteraceae bacterium]|nr:hypothetical protein [Desulfobacteraceae bacterium]
MTQWNKEHTITIEGLEIANYMIEHNCEMIGVENIPDSLNKVRMIFRGEDVHTAYGKSLSMELPELSLNEIDRLFSMLSLLICARKQELKEEEEL